MTLYVLVHLCVCACVSVYALYFCMFLYVTYATLNYIKIQHFLCHLEYHLNSL